MELFVLDDNGNPVRAKTTKEWAGSRNYGPGPKSWRVGLTHMPAPFQGTYVSTVFLGLDHNYLGDGPILWESMVFTDGASDSKDFPSMRRCGGTRADALKMHEEMVRDVTAHLKLPPPAPAPKPEPVPSTQNLGPRRLVLP